MSTYIVSYHGHMVWQKLSPETQSQLILALTVAQLAVYVKCAFYNMYLHTEASNVAFVGRSPLATVALDE